MQRIREEIEIRLQNVDRKSLKDARMWVHLSERDRYIRTRLIEEKRVLKELLEYIDKIALGEPEVRYGDISYSCTINEDGEPEVKRHVHEPKVQKLYRTKEKAIEACFEEAAKEFHDLRKSLLKLKEHIE